MPSPPTNTAAEPSATRSFWTKLLHLLLASAVIHQVVVSNFMRTPGPGRTENLAFEFHEYTGLATLALVTVFWLWTVARRRESTFGALFPWVFPSRLRALRADLVHQVSAWRRGKLPNDEQHAFASAVHGLGLSVVTVMAVTGSLSVLFGLSSNLRPVVLEVHEITAKLLWTYVIGHAGIAILHEVAGHRLIRRMFFLERQQTESPR